MRVNVRKTALLLAAAFIFTGCATPAANQPSQTPSNQPGVNTPASPANPAAAAVETNFSLFNVTSDGVSNPVTPDQIEYLELNGKKVMAKEIQIVKTGDKLTGDIRFKGEGDYSFNATGGNKDVLKVKLVGSSQVAEVPLFKPGQEGFKVQAVTSYAFRLVLTTDADGNVTGVKGVVDTLVDGVVSGESNTAFEVSGGNVTYQTGGNAVSAPLSIVVATSQNLTVKPATPNDNVVKQVKADAKPTSIDGYIGVWKYSVPGAGEVLLALRKTGSQKFQVSTTVAGKTYSAKGDYPAGEAAADKLNVELSITTEKMVVEIKNPSANILELTLVSGGPDAVASFKNIPLSMSRVVN